MSPWYQDAAGRRREWLKLTVGGSVSLGLGGLLDLTAVKAAAQNLKLTNVTEFTISCNFCSCGCGLVASAVVTSAMPTRLTPWRVSRNHVGLTLGAFTELSGV